MKKSNITLRSKKETFLHKGKYTRLLTSLSTKASTLCQHILLDLELSHFFLCILQLSLSTDIRLWLWWVGQSLLHYIVVCHINEAEQFGWDVAYTLHFLVCCLKKREGSKP